MKRRLIVLTALLLGATPALAQDTALADALRQADVPRELRASIEAFLAEPATTRHAGALRVDAGEAVRGGVAVVDGPLIVAGRVEGDLVMLRGTIRLEPGARVGGDVTVVCGEVTGPTSAVKGTLTVYDRAFCGEALAKSAPAARSPRRVAAPGPSMPGHARLAVRIGRNYNRVEGLPIRIGPVIETGGRAPIRVEALAVLRSESGVDSDGVGYDVRVEQSFGGGSPVRVGGTLRSVVDPIESAGVRDTEASLAAALFRHDARDYFERTGWSAYARWSALRSPVDAVLEYRDESHASRAARNPWSLFNGGDGWRPQPLVAEGSLRSIAGGVEIDTRDRADKATRGWYATARVERGIGGELALPEHDLASPPDQAWAIIHPARVVDTDFTTAHIEARRYQRVGHSALLNVRAVLAGSLTSSPLPPQFQHALGGIGTLPGYATLSGDCGARSQRVRPIAHSTAHPASPFYNGYGCDRAFLVQAEYVGPFGLDIDVFHHDRERSARHNDWWPTYLDLRPTWVVFFDAGRGWALGDAADPVRQDTEMLYDAGIGILFGELGIYAAAPLRGEGRNLNVFLRLGRRF